MIELHKQDRLIKKILPKQKLRPGCTYRFSCFLIPFSYCGRPCIHSTLTKQAFEVSREYDLTAVFSSEDVEADGELLALFEAHFIVPLDADENALYLSLSDMMRTFFRVNGYTSYTILPTLACNARCVYCYEEGMKPVTMTEKTVEDTIEFIDRTRKKDSPLIITWFGGEPLICEDIIDRICSAMKERGIEFYSSMVSNGSLIDERIAEKMKNEWNLSGIQISLDGDEECYKARKRFVKYEDTYNKVLKAINILQEHGIVVHFRCNVDFDNIESVPRMIEDAARAITNKENVHIYLAPLNQVRNSDKDLELWRIIDVKKKILPKYGFPEGTNLRIRKSFHVYRCMADCPSSSVAIMPDGRLSPCLQCESYSIYGNIWDGITDREVFNKYLTTGPVREQCKNCVFLPDCTAFAYCPVINKNCRERRMEMALSYLPEMAEEAERLGAPLEEGLNPEELDAKEKAKLDIE